jgi:TonB family protein
MKVFANLLLVATTATLGCHHALDFRGGCVVSPLPKPLVTVESVAETADSPGRGTTLFPCPRPVYPTNLLQANISGRVIVRVAVGSDGAVRESSVVSSTQSEFSAPARLAAEQWRFIEFRDPGVKERKAMVLDCTIKFAVSFDDEVPLF